MSAENVRMLKLMVRGSYDLQALRMQTGLRLCANFRAKLKDVPTEKPEEEEEDAPIAAPDELSEDAIKIIDLLKASYRRLTDGVARNRTIPTASGFVGDELISEYTELVLADQYFQLEAQETRQFSQLIFTLQEIPIFNEYLAATRGIGPALAAVLITYFDPHRAKYASSFWKYAGLDVGPDGAGRSRRAEHLINRQYIDKNGNEATRLSTTYNPWLKMKLLGGLGPSFLRSRSPWRESFDSYRHRIMTDPGRTKVTLAEWKKLHAASKKEGGEPMPDVWPPGRIKNAALRYMVKVFLADYWAKWRELEGLPVAEPYYVAKLGMTRHGGAAAE